MKEDSFNWNKTVLSEEMQFEMKWDSFTQFQTTK